MEMGTETREKQREEVRKGSGERGWQWGGLSTAGTDAVTRLEPGVVSGGPSRILALKQACCVALGESLPLSGFHFPTR